jgi:hypothetical protein
MGRLGFGHTVLAAFAVGIGAGCSATDGAGDGADMAAAPSAPRSVLRVMFAPDSAAAVEAADSLGREGWESTVGRRGSETTQWPVQITVPGDGRLSALVAYALRREGLAPEAVGASPSRRPLTVEVTRVNDGTHGMSARIRWTFSADRRNILVVEDPHGVENEPVPNGFAMATEGASLIQRDSVWDVAPSPDWRQVAYARAYTTAPGESDTIPPSEWHRLAGRVGLLESTVRKNAFPTSAMVVAFGAARPFVVDASAPTAGDPSRDTALPIAEGWRLAWSANGARLAIGAPSEVVSDDGAATQWRLVDPSTGAPRGGANPATLTRVQWTEGPTIDISTPIDMMPRRAFRTGDSDIESEHGWIRVFARDGARMRSPRIIGPGVALTATANGEFIIAIAPDPNAKSYDPPNHLIVYHITRR